MYKFEISSPLLISPNSPYELQKSLCDKYANKIYDVKIVEYLSSDITGRVSRGNDLLSGTYFNSVSTLSKISNRTNSISKVLKKNGVHSNKPILLFEIGNGLNNKYNNLKNQAVIDILNSIIDINIIMALAPMDIKNIGIIIYENNNIDGNLQGFKLCNGIDIDGQKADVYIADVI